MSTKTKVKLVIIVLCIGIWSIAITSLLLKNGHEEQIEDTVTDPTQKFIITTTTQMDYQWIDKYATEEPKNGIEYVQDYYDSLLCIFQGENCVYDYSGFDTIPPSWINEYSPCQGMEYNSTLYLYCIRPTWLNDGYCDEECNHPDFDYDGGDCCLDIVNNAKCIDCYCYEDCSIHQLRFIDGIDLQSEVDCYEHSDHDWNSCPYSWLNDGVCNDECNHDLFDYDLNDCCLKDSNYMYCEDCICYANCTKMPIDWQSIFGGQ